jgi:hypothetical protein
MAFEQTKPITNKVGVFWESYSQIYFNGVTTGEFNSGLKRVFGMSAIETGCDGGNNQISVNEDLYGTNGGKMAEVAGNAITITGDSGDYWIVRSVGYL